jgi:hypothetical protein
MPARIALVTNAEDVSALQRAGIDGGVRVLALTLRARLAARRVGIAYEDLDGLTSKLDRRSILADALRFARAWSNQPFVAGSGALAALSDWRGYPLLAMQSTHLRYWFAEALSSLAVARLIVDHLNPDEVWLADRPPAPGYWCTPLQNCDAAALAIVAERTRVPVRSLPPAGGGRSSFQRLRDWLKSAPPKSNAREPAVDAATRTADPHVGRVLVIARGHHYWPLMEPCVQRLAERAHVVVAAHDPIECGAGVPVLSIAAMLKDDVGDVRRLCRATHSALDADERVAAFFTDRCDTPFWPLIRRKFVTLFEHDVPETARHLLAAERLVDEHRPDVVFVALCESGIDAAYPIAARKRGIPSMTLQHGLILDGNAAAVAPAADVYATWGRLTQRQLIAATGRSEDALPIVGCPAPLRAAHGAEARSRLGLDGNRPVCQFLGALGWAVNDVNRYAEEALLAAVLDLPDQIPGLQLIIRLHAGEDVDSLRALAEERGATACIQPDVSLEELLAASDIVVSQTTTAALWAMRAGRPVVYLNALSERDWLPFATRGAALGVHGLDELAGAVRRTLSDSELRRGLSGGARTLVADALETVGADAGRRVAELCETMMAAAASRRAVNETACV